MLRNSYIVEKKIGMFMLKNKIKINMVMSVVLLVSMTIIACNMDKVATVEMEKENKNVKTKNGKVVVIDPGHGGCR